MDQLAGALRITLGPRGRNVVIHRKDGFPAITNDGLAIAREVELADPCENMGVRLLKEVATKTGESAGDGTTTAVVLGHRIVGEGLRAVAAGCHPIAVKRGIDRAVATVVEEIARTAVRVESRSDLVRVATVSAQHDAAVGELIADALERVGRHGLVSVEDGHGFDTRLEVVEGVRFDRGYLSPYFITDPESMSVTFEDALLLFTDFKLRSAQQMLPRSSARAEMGRPLLVVADDVEGEALATLVVNRLRGTLASVAVKAPAIGEERRAQLDDLALLTGARLFATEQGMALERVTSADFGHARRVRRSREHHAGRGRRRSGCDSPATRAAPWRARERGLRLRARPPPDAALALAGRRRGDRGGCAHRAEMRERRSRIDDALAATRAAIEEGVVVGGGVALLRAQAALDALVLEGDEARGRDIVRRALEEPIRQIAHNAGEAGGRGRGARAARVRRLRLRRAQRALPGSARHRRDRPRQGGALRAAARRQYRRPGADHRRHRGGHGRRGTRRLPKRRPIPILGRRAGAAATRRRR